MIPDRSSSSQALDNNLRVFYERMEKILDGLNNDQRQWFLEGLVHAFDAVTRYTDPNEISPFDREMFIGSALSFAYSKTYHLNLDPESRMKTLVESQGKESAHAFLFAQFLHELLSCPLDMEQEMRVKMMVSVAQLER